MPLAIRPEGLAAALRALPALDGAAPVVNTTSLGMHPMAR